MTDTKAEPTAARRPRPAINEDNAYFWEGVDAGELRVQQCVSCGHRRHPSAPCCPYCNSFDWDHVVVSGQGEIYSYVVMHHPLVPPFDAPYTVAVIQLHEGERIVSQLIGIEPEKVEIGLPVEVDFVDVDPELRLPLFRPVS